MSTSTITKPIIRIVVGSTNPVKCEATRLAFAEAWPDKECVVNGVKAASRVSDQPMGDTETFNGARNRAQESMRLQPEAEFWVGIEGGCEDMSSFVSESKERPHDNLSCYAWIYIISQISTENGTVLLSGKSKTGTFFLPAQVAELVAGGMELGHADDAVFDRSNSKQSNGAVGILTRDMITRTSYYTPTVTLALVPFLNQQLYLY